MDVGTRCGRGDARWDKSSHENRNDDGGTSSQDGSGDAALHPAMPGLPCTLHRTDQPLFDGRGTPCRPHPYPALDGLCTALHGYRRFYGSRLCLSRSHMPTLRRALPELRGQLCRGCRRRSVGQRMRRPVPPLCGILRPHDVTRHGLMNPSWRLYTGLA